MGDEDYLMNEKTLTIASLSASAQGDSGRFAPIPGEHVAHELETVAFRHHQVEDRSAHRVLASSSQAPASTRWVERESMPGRQGFAAV